MLIRLWRHKFWNWLYLFAFSIWPKVKTNILIFWEEKELFGWKKSCFIIFLYFNEVLKHFHQNILEVKQNLHWPMIRKIVHIRENLNKARCWRGVVGPWGVTTLGKFCNFSSFLSLETVFPALKLTLNGYLNMNISFSWKLAI